MKIGLQTWGTEGDVRPFVALGAALRARGHEVRLVYTNVEGRDFDGLASACGVPARSVGREYFVTHAEENARRARASFERGNPLRQIRLIVEDLMAPVALDMLEAGKELASWSDAMVGHFLGHPAGTAAEAAGRPYAIVALQPVFPSALYPPVGFPNLGRWLNPLSWRVVLSLLESVFRERVNALRRREGLAEVRGMAATLVDRTAASLVAVSPSLFPRPADWSSKLEVSGFLSLPETAERWEPDAALADALAKRPVFFTFGSMLNLDGGASGSDERSSRTVRTLVEAAELAGLPAIIQAPRAVTDAMPSRPGITWVERVPHAALFPRCAAIVHHGGAGTVQSALRAGRPSIVVPHAADQFHWAALLHDKRLAASPLPIKKLDPQALGARLRAVASDDAMVRNAEAIARSLREEHGPERAAELLERAFR